MSKSAKIFISFTIAAGLAVVLQSLLQARLFPHGPSYFWFCGAGILSSLLKVRLPRVTGTVSANFLVILVATAMFSLSETVLLTAVSCLVQCMLRTRRRPAIAQVLFNIATLALSSALTYRVAHLFAGWKNGNVVLLLTLGACFYFIANTFLVSGVLSLVEHKRLLAVWHQCYLWSFPYYLIGAAIAGLVVFTGQALGWQASLAVVPTMYLVYLFYRGCVGRWEDLQSAVVG
jgi:hypothetical protein